MGRIKMTAGLYKIRYGLVALVVVATPVAAIAIDSPSPPPKQAMEPPVPTTTNMVLDGPAVSAVDVDCVLKKLGSDGRDKIVQNFVLKMQDNTPNKRMTYDIVPIILPSLMHCEKTLKWKSSQLSDTTFHLLGKIAGDHYFAQAADQKFDITGIRSWFAKQPEDLKLGWFSPQMDTGVSDSELLRMLSDLETAKIATDPMINDMVLTKLVMKSLVIETRLAAGLGGFKGR